MTDAFRQLCTEVDRATQTVTSVELCRPHYQKVLDYILEHPEERDDIATTLVRQIKYEAQIDGLRVQIYLVQFLMQTLRWPEIKAATEDVVMNHAGNVAYYSEIKRLLEIYDSAD